MTLSVPQPSHLLEIAQQAAALALRTAAAVDDRSIATDKGDGDFATATDIAVEQAISAFLAQHSPYPVQGEERTPGEAAPTRWAIDPVDGTYNFAARLPLCAFSIGLLSDGVAQLGAIAHFASGEVTSALATGPLLVGGKPVEPRRLEITQGIIGADISGKPDRNHSGPFLAAFMDQLWQRAGGVRMFATAAMELAWTAQGRLAGCVLGTAHPWDVVGGVALVHGAGGVVLGAQGEPWTPDSTLLIASAHPDTAAELATMVAAARAASTVAATA